MNTRTKLYAQLDEYADFINNEYFANQKLSHFIAEVQDTYCADKLPWIIGYSGGKDSTAVMSLVYLALKGLEEKRRSKPIFVVSSDTLVETPIVVNHVNDSLKAIAKGAKRDNLPITVHKVTPKIQDTFWVNILGRGYPAPTRKFRWCTDRMKIDPVSDFIKQKVSKYEEVIVVLASRRKESASRSEVIAKHKIDHSRLSIHTTLTNSFIYTPIDTWSNDDVWKMLRMCSFEAKRTSFGIKNVWKDDYGLEWETPWGSSNLKLFRLYLNSSNLGECPMVIDTSTPSCGNSRFGCWTCTVTTSERVMESLTENGEQWMKPLQEFRDMLAKTSMPENKGKYRNYLRGTGEANQQYLKNDEGVIDECTRIPSTYKMKYRQEWLQKLLEIEKKLKNEGQEIELITKPELNAIRQYWLEDPTDSDVNDTLPKIFSSVYGLNLDLKIP